MIDYTVTPSAKSRWAMMLDQLSVGLGKIGEMREKRDLADAESNRLDHREAARQAFDMNLARFKDTGDTDREKERAANEEKLLGTRLGAEQNMHTEDITSRTKLEEARIAEEKAYHAGSLGIEGARLSAENTRAATADARAAEAAKRDTSNADKNRATEAGKSTQTDLNAELSQARDIEKQLGDPMMKFDKTGAKDALQKELDAHKAAITGLQSDLREQRKQAGYTSSLDKTSGAGADAKMAPDRQAIYNSMKAKNPGADPAAIMQKVQAIPQSDIDKMMALPGAPGTKPTADTTGATLGQNPADSGPGNFMSLADAGPPSQPSTLPQPATGGPAGSPANATSAGADPLAAAEPQGADQSATTQDASAMGGQQVAATGGAPDSGTAPPMNADGTPQTTNDKVAQDQQFGQMEQQLNATPEGQGVHATLDRLAQTDNPVQKEKFTRQAQIQLQSQFPDQDPQQYIDWYQEQQQQQPEYS